MKIAIVGGGNIGTQFAVHSAVKGHETVIFTSKPNLFHEKISIVNENNDTILTGSVKATDDVSLACSDAELIFVTLPAFCIKKFADELYPVVKNGAKICIVPGTGGGECCFKDFLNKNCVIFGLQRVPSVARVVEYGKTVRAVGYRKTLHVSAIPSAQSETCAKIIEEIFDIHCEYLSEYLCLTLTPSNPILHTTRLYTIFKDYKTGVGYSSIPLFYEDWTDETSDLIFKCDEELQTLCKRLLEFKLDKVVSLKIHYESDTVSALTKKIKSITGFKGIKTPSVYDEKDKKFYPDLSSRYFISDFSYGLEIIAQIADLVGLDLKHVRFVLDWYNKIAECKTKFNYADYGIVDYKSFLNFYKV